LRGRTHGSHSRADRRQGKCFLERCFEDIELELTSSDLRCGAKEIGLSFKEFEVMKR
jgi:hypothetical protein